MGGEYEFGFSTVRKPFDLKKYQQFVLNLREKYYNHPECVFYRTEEEMSVGDNILAKFKYQCSRHSSSDDEHGTWHILWDPTLDPEYKGDKTHGRCSEYTFKEVHKQLVAAFPGKFRVYDDDLAAYRADSYYDSYSSNYHSSEEVPDYAACDKDDCGYCGKCNY